MAEIKYNSKQIQELLNNKYVKNCTNKNISFTKECKLEVIKQGKKGIFYRDIFKSLGFSEYIVSSKIPERSYNRWKKNAEKGKIELKKGRKKTEYNPDKMTKDEYIEYLEMKLAIFEELKKIDSGEYP